MAVEVSLVNTSGNGQRVVTAITVKVRKRRRPAGGQRVVIAAAKELDLICRSVAGERVVTAVTVKVRIIQRPAGGERVITSTANKIGIALGSRQAVIA